MTPRRRARVARRVPPYFPRDRVRQTGPTSASEDFGSFGAEWQVPSVFWFVGGTDPGIYAKAKAVRTDQRASDQPQSALRARDASDA